MLEKRCNCGEAMEVARLELEGHLRCPACKSEASDKTTYHLDQGDVPPDLRPYQTRPKPISSVETMEILTVDTSPLRGISPVEETSDLGRIPLDVDSQPGFGTDPPRDPPPAGEEYPILPEGTELGTFKILGALGQGGMGVVYKAYDSALDRHVALKVLSQALSRNKSFIERFRREAMACGKLSHPNITHIYSISSKEESFHYFAMEFVEGQNLAEWVKEKGPFPWQQALDIGLQSAQGLREAAQAKIIHRDIKPSNLLLTADGRVKITDFGLAKARASIGHTLDLTSTGVVMGTPLYMSPEQGRGGKVDHRSDIYSLGGTLFFLTFGCPPFEADSPIALILKHINDPLAFPPHRKVPKGMKHLLVRMMEKDVSRRTATYEELIKDLQRARRGESLGEDHGTRVIVLPKARRPTTGRSKKKSGTFTGLKATKLSVARTNIKLGRRDKAVSLLQETIDDGDPTLRAEAALLLLTLYEKENDLRGVRRMAETVLVESADPAAQAYAAWKLAVLDEQAAIEQTRTALRRYEGILRDPPSGMPREVIEEQVRRLRSRIAEAERDTGTTRVVLGGDRK